MQKSIKRRFVAGATCPKCQELDTISLYYENNVEKLECVACGYNEVEMSWVLEDNVEMCKPLELMGGKIYKRYRVFEKNL